MEHLENPSLPAAQLLRVLAPEPALDGLEAELGRLDLGLDRAVRNQVARLRAHTALSEPPERLAVIRPVRPTRVSCSVVVKARRRVAQWTNVLLDLLHKSSIAST